MKMIQDARQIMHPDARRKSANAADARELRVGRELLDTTWRIAVPVVLFAGLGLALDRSLGTAPWLTLVGMVAGFGVAALLIRQQLRRWPDTPVVPGSYDRNRQPGDDDRKGYFDD